MFKFLKDKLKNAVDKFYKDVYEESDEIVEEVEVEKPKPKPKKKAAKKTTKTKETKKKEEKPVKKQTKKKDSNKQDPVQEEAQKIVEEVKELEKELEETKLEEPQEEDIEDKIEEDLQEELPEPAQKKRGFLSKIFSKKEAEPENEDLEETSDELLDDDEVEPKEAAFIEGYEDDQDHIEDEQSEEDLEEEPEDDEEPKEEKKGFFAKLKQTVVSKKLSESKFEDLFFDLEIVLLENNVAVQVIDKIKQDLREKIVNQKINRSQIEQIVFKTLRDSIEEILSFEKIDFFEKIKEKKPYVILFLGINGTGKTTTIAKLASAVKDKGLTPVLVAADTFRAAAIQQLEEHAKNLDIKIIKHDYGSDPAAVAFDGIKHAKDTGADVVFVDTAGRLHSNTNLMGEMDKIIRVAKPDMKIFVGESTTGNDCVEQATKFNDLVNLDGIILSKADVDEKGGAAISASFVTGKPIMFLGTGQEYKDIEEFDKDKIIKKLFD